MERWVTPEGTKKKIYKCYNCGIKKHLARDYRKPKTGLRSQNNNRHWGNLRDRF